MKTCKTAVFLVGLLAASSSIAFAQSPSTTRVFVDGTVAFDRNPTERFHGSDDGRVGRAAVGAASGHHDWRIEVDIPAWRTIDTDHTGPIYCAPDSKCGPGYVPGRVQEHSAFRTISTAVLYAQHLPAFARTEVALVGGGAIEHETLKYSQQTDFLDDSGRVISHSAYAHDYPVGTLSGVIGVDAQVHVTSHLAVVPQVRYHFFPYPEVSILRPGISVRWTF